MVFLERSLTIRRARNLSVIVFLILCSCRPAGASTRFDSLGGLDQSFVQGYTERKSAENFHYNQVYGAIEAEKKAEEDKKYEDRWRYVRQFSAVTTYDDNFSKKFRDPKGEMVTNYSPTVGMIRRGKGSFLEMFYAMSYVHYVQNETSSGFTGYSQTTNLGYDFNRLKINISNSFSPNTSVARGQRTELRADDAANDSVVTYADGLSMNLDYQFSEKTQLAFKYGIALLYFPSKKKDASSAVSTTLKTDNNNSSTLTSSYGTSISYRLTPKIGVSTSYNYQTVDFYRGGTNGSQNHNINVGVSGKISPKTSADISVGFSRREYQDPQTIPSDGFVWQIGISRPITPKITGSLSTSQNISENFDTSLGQSLMQTSNAYSLALTWKASARMSVENNFSYVITERQGFITQVDPDNPTLTFTREQGNQNFSWDITWNWSPKDYCSFLLGYEYVNANASFKASEFDDHKFLGSASVSF